MSVRCNYEPLNLLSQYLKPLLLVASLALIGSQFLTLAAEREFPLFIDQISIANNVSLVVYYLLALIGVYYILKSERTNKIKIIISICMLIVVPPVSMIIFIAVDGKFISTPNST